RIADFGISRVNDAVVGGGETTRNPLSTPTLTRAGELFGTPAYMAPELAGGVDVANNASDIFALGVVAFELLTGRVPFEAPPIVAALQKQSLPKLDVVDGPLADLVARMLSFDPAQRPSANEVREALEQFKPAG